MTGFDWVSMPHECPEEMLKYLMMICEACDADNELKMMTRFQKVMRKIHDDMADVREKARKYDQLNEPN